MVEPITEQLATPKSMSPIAAPTKPGEGYVTASWLFLLAALILVGIGFYRMYSYDELSDKLVGGDAYNYIVLATRGVGFIVAGCTAAVIAATFAVLAVFNAVSKY